VAAVALLGLLFSAAYAQDAPRRVTFNGAMGDKALLVIDGQPRTLAPGAAWRGVRLIGIAGGEAKVDVDGQRLSLRIGESQASVGDGPRAGAGTQIVLVAGTNGHFITSGSINGRTVDFLVDTGASTVSLSQAEADRIGLSFRDGKRGMAHTANGPVPVNQVTLNSVRIGDVDTYNVEAIVLPAQLPHVLLGNSFLVRFQMKRENDRMVLEKRP